MRMSPSQQRNKVGVTSSLHFAEEETEAQRGEVLCPKSHSLPGTKPGGSDPSAHAFSQLFILHKGGSRERADGRGLPGLMRKQEAPSLTQCDSRKGPAEEAQEEMEGRRGSPLGPCTSCVQTHRLTNSQRGVPTVRELG